MTDPLRILSIEDDPKDTELIQDLLQAAVLVCDVTRVDTEAALRACLQQGQFDLILADYTLPSFDGISALKLALSLRPEVPFIFVSGTLGEEVAIEALKIGATDYILKTRLSRLVPSVLRALREATDRAERKQADEKLRRSEAHLTEAQRLSQTGSFGCKLPTGEMYWSEETYRVYGYDRSTQPAVERVLERVHPEDKHLVLEQIDRASRGGKDCQVECRLLLPDNSVKHVRIVAHALKNESGTIEFIGAVMDITAAKHAGEKLRRSEAYLAEAQRLSHTGSFGWDVCSGDIYWSAETFRIFECEPTTKVGEELIVQRSHPDDRVFVRQVIDHASKTRKDFDVEHRLLLPDGSVKYVRVVGHCLDPDDAGKVEFVGAVTDITERKRAEEALRRTESYLTEAQRLTHTGSWVWEVVRRDAVYLSDEWYRIYSFDPAEGMPVWEKRVERVHPADRARWLGEIERAIRERADYDVEFRIALPDGTVKSIHTVGHPILNERGDLVQFVGTSTDITERKRAEETLRRSEAYLAEGQRMTRSGSWAWDVRTDALFWSQEIFRIYDLDPEKEKPTWTTLLDRVHPEDRAAVEQRKKMESRQKELVNSEIDFRIVLPDGKIKRLHTIAHPMLDESGEVSEVVGMVMDVTEQHEAREALQRSEGYLAEAQRLSRTGSWAWNVRTSDLFWSQEMFRIFDYPETITPSMSRFFERVHPEDRPLIEQRANTESSQTGWEDSGVDYRIVLPDGTIKHLHSVAHPVTNESGELTEIIGTTMDVTEQCEARAALEIAFEQIKVLKDQLYKENIALREEIDRSSMFEEIVGESPALQEVLANVMMVAPTDSTVLITGETGTGKELIARAIHKRSQRAARAFVSVNCAAIPSSLIASELFGHEKGAFTGAVQRRLGRFELAEGGTIFLDEIGELPLETQISLLRVLQEREFERVGGTKVIRVNVRVIAATNRDLQSCIEAGSFRSDLYYRLNVFPIDMPPLRKRKEDIPLLVEYFIDRYATKAGKKIRGINRATLDRLKAYPWPGNIRELQNVIERSVIVCETENFAVDERWLSPGVEEPMEAPQPPLFKMPPVQEKQTIEAALAAAQGKISGPAGAAARLGIPASTLDSKIKAFKINKHRFKTV